MITIPLNPVITNVRFYFGRLNLIASYDNKHEFLLDIIKTSPGSSTAFNGWNFFEVEELEHEGEKFIHGYLVRFKMESTDQNVDLKTRRFITRQVQNSTQGQANFFLHSKTGIIAFHTNRNRIELKTFVTRFEATFTAGRTLVQGEIQMIEDRKEIFTRLNELQTVESVIISLHPSNPRSARLWQKVDEDLNELGASSYNESIYGKRDKEGTARLNVKALTKNNDIEAKMAMAEDGYGTAEVRGTIDGKTVVHSTRDNPVTETVHLTENDHKGTLKSLSDAFKRLFNRINQ